jgi:hypothetical protein
VRSDEGKAISVAPLCYWAERSLRHTTPRDCIWEYNAEALCPIVQRRAPLTPNDGISSNGWSRASSALNGPRCMLWREDVR